MFCFLPNLASINLQILSKSIGLRLHDTFKTIFKNFGFLEFLVSASAIFVISMLIWTASTRPAVEAKANLVKENHNKVVDLINEEINKCGNNDEGKFTVWGDPCNGEWIADKVVNYINKNLKIENPFSDDSKVKTDPDPRIKAEGKAGQAVEMGVIFVMSSNFLPDPGSEWIVGTCFKSPCVAAGNNELTSIYR